MCSGRVYAARILEKSESRVIALKKTRHSDYVEHPPLLHEACGLVLADSEPIYFFGMFSRLLVY